jgi:hypothetical protein
MIVHNVFLNFGGQRGARLHSDQFTHETSANSPSLLLRIVSYFMYSAPRENLERLKKVFIGGLFLSPKWTEFIGEMRVESDGYVVVVCGPCRVWNSNGVIRIGYRAVAFHRRISRSPRCDCDF